MSKFELRQSQYGKDSLDFNETPANLNRKWTFCIVHILWSFYIGYKRQLSALIVCKLQDHENIVFPTSNVLVVYHF